MKDSSRKSIPLRAVVNEIGLTLIFLLAGCSAPPSTPEMVTPTSTPTPGTALRWSTPTTTESEQSSEDNQSPVVPPASGSISRNPPLSGQTQENLSPAYDIYIGFNLVGAPCGWDQNAGGFSRLAWVSDFYNVRFTLPPDGWNGESPFESDMVDDEAWSVTELADYAWCPTYESDQVYQCFVTEGPYPFESYIYVRHFLDFELDEIPLLIPPVTDPLDEGPDLYLAYHIWGSVGDHWPTILCSGDGHLGDCAGVACAEALPPEQVWPISLQRVKKGEEFLKEFGSIDEDGDQITWSVHFVPVQNP